MKLSTPTKTISNIPRSSRGETITFSALAESCDVPETTLRRLLQQHSVPIPSKGFGANKAARVQQWVSCSKCARAWEVIANHSDDDAEISAAKHRTKSLRTKIVSHLKSLITN